MLSNVVFLCRPKPTMQQKATPTKLPEWCFRHETLGILIPIFRDSLVSRTCQELMDPGQWGQAECGSSAPSAASA